MNIVLLGCRGAGKSTIARILAKRLHRRLFSIDILIGKAAGMNIPEIIEKNGWGWFREIEAEQVQAIAGTHNNVIIDCGGGVVLNSDNIHQLKQKGRVVWLIADLADVLKRIGHDTNRPRLKKRVSLEEEQKQLMLEREIFYRDAADFICDTTHFAPEETASSIIRFFREKHWI